MEQHIIEVLYKIEKEYHIKILYACESGSRAWGYFSSNSDYDVRFIYIHKKEWYLSIDQQRDVIEIPVDDAPLHEQLDIHGWEFTKALRLFRKSNPGLLEWLGSPIIYMDYLHAADKMREMEKDVFSPAACLHHYLNTAKSNYRHFLHHEEMKVKSYFNMLRPILAGNWIEKYGSFPPASFQDLAEDILLKGSLLEEINTLLKKKLSGEEENVGFRTEILNAFMEEEISRLEETAKKLQYRGEDPTFMLNQLFRETLDAAWDISKKER
ncbi:nucleotidyltransferase domain-containing protein [Bacillus lacus]|uniref:Nucleotidyltransferase domain-containing protein n=1 Tax=Metabacillus lacus TaxID=1983721 RepID=A0A7X2J0M7_9BACI|nr:nucleotidyltransferase domain-containing protein [Metabacillus lacus]MRX73260.1 nucleotidyltransferase domain-containing protein [Metabacillus lacus]